MAAIPKTSGGWRGEGMGEGIDIYMCLGKGKRVQPLWKSVGRLLRKGKNSTAICPLAFAQRTL